MHKQTEKLINQLEAKQLDRFLFFSDPIPTELPHVYGGQVLSESLNCAIRTVSEDRQMHSMHAYFLRAGDIHAPIIYEVTPIRDGGTYTTRRVVAKQHGKEIYTTTVSFSLDEQGLEHQTQMPEVKKPEQLIEDRVLIEQWLANNPDSKPPRNIDILGAFETKSTSHSLLKPKKGAEAKLGYWLKSAEPLPDTVKVHQALLAYISDMRLIGAALVPHGISFGGSAIQIASLDHALWIHRPFRIDEWLYYEMESPSASGGRGLARGQFFDLSGNLVASSAQEGLIRQRTINK